MKKLVKVMKIVLVELGLMEDKSLFYEQKRQALRHRLQWVFFVDSLEGYEEYPPQ